MLSGIQCSCDYPHINFQGERERKLLSLVLACYHKITVSSRFCGLAGISSSVFLHMLPRLPLSIESLKSNILGHEDGTRLFEGKNSLSQSIRSLLLRIFSRGAQFVGKSTSCPIIAIVIPVSTKLLALAFPNFEDACARRPSPTRIVQRRPFLGIQQLHNAECH